MSDVSPQVEAVVQRWNPDGMTLLRRLRLADAHGRAVALFSPHGADSTILADELAQREPRIDIVAAPLEATVVLMVLDSGSVLGQHDLHAINELLTTGSRAVFALNGIEAHRGWQSVRDRDVALLTRHTEGDRDLRVWPASPRLSSIARKIANAGVGDGPLVDACSGMAALHAAICEALPDDPAAERDAHLHRGTAAVIRDTHLAITAEAESLQGEDSALAAMRLERTQLTARRDGGRAEQLSALRSQLQLARVDLLHDTGQRARAANVAARTDTDRTDPTELPLVPQRTSDLVMQLTAQVDQDIANRLNELVHRVGLTDLTHQPAGARTPAPTVGDGPPPRHRGIEDRLVIGVGAASGAGLAKLATMPLELVPALSYATLPAALLLGGAAAWWLTRSRQQLADRNHVRQWVADTLVNAKAQLEQRVVGTLVETESILVDQVVRSTAGRAVEIDRRVAELSAKIRDATAKRDGRLAACQRDLAVLATLPGGGGR